MLFIKEYKGRNCHRILLGFLADSFGFFSRVKCLFTGDVHSSAKYFDQRSLKTSLPTQF